MAPHPQTLAQKIWNAHRVALRNDGREVIYMDRLVIHELHGPHAFERVSVGKRTVRRPDLTFGVLDHAVSTRPDRTEDNSKRGGPLAKGMRAATERWGIKLFGLDDPRQGISHVVAPELALVLPGSTYSCPDSHAGTVGGIGVLGFACGTTDLEHVLVTQTMALASPKQMRITLTGQLAASVTAKDVALHVIRIIGPAGGRGHAIEFAGTVTEALSVEGRMTLCNMIVEAGARTSIVAPDQKVFDWLAPRQLAPRGAQWDEAMIHWLELKSDANAAFDTEIMIDCGAISRQITWGTDQSQVINISEVIPDLSGLAPEKRAAAERALAYMGLSAGQKLEGLAVDRVYIGSCTNARIEDLESAAAILRGRRVAAGVRAVIVPGSTSVKREAERRGLDAIFIAAGFEWHESGCGLCSGSNGDAPSPARRFDDKPQF